MSEELAKAIIRARAFSGTVNAGARKAAQGGKPQRTVREECGGHRTMALGGETRAKFFAVRANLTPSSTNFDTSGAKSSRWRAESSPESDVAAEHEAQSANVPLHFVRISLQARASPTKRPVPEPPQPQSLPARPRCASGPTRLRSGR